MNKLFFLFLVISSNLCANDHFDFYDLLNLESNLYVIEEKISHYEGVINSEDFGIIKHNLKNSRFIITKKIQNHLGYEK